MIRLITDTTCGLPLSLLAEKGIDVIPQIIIFGDQSYRDDHEIDSDTFLEKLKASSILPKTAAPPPVLYHPFFREYAQKGDTILVLTPSGEVSGTYRSASIAAEEFPEADIHIVDTRTIAGGFGALVLQAKDWIDHGMVIAELKENVLDMARREKVYFVVDTLEYLEKGGRIGKATALLGSLLQVKPILTVEDGLVNQFEKQRTSKHAIQRMLDLVIGYSNNSHDPHITISHISADETVLQVRDSLRKALGIIEIPILKLPPAIIVHGGPGIVSVSCFTR